MGVVGRQRGQMPDGLDGVQQRVVVVASGRAIAGLDAVAQQEGGDVLVVGPLIPGDDEQRGVVRKAGDFRISGTTRANQWSPAAIGPSCMSSQRLGVMKAKLGVV